jgi:uncharacterized repeat protein (TIGR01451 family)
MKKVSILANASLTGIVAASIIAVPAFACAPQGMIVKEVQNQTTGTLMNDANTASNATSATTGDTLLYTITVSNKGATAKNGDNDILNTKLTDTLPAGVELASNPASRTITEDLGVIAPGKSVTKTYAVKVTSTTDGDVITNKACYNGDSKVKDYATQSGCDVAVVKVKVTTPETPATPTTPAAPVTPTTPAATVETPTVLPDTGSTALSTSLIMGVALVGGYIVNTMRLKFRTND